MTRSDNARLRRRPSSRFVALERLEGRSLLATLIPGNPVTVGTPTTFMGVGLAGAGSVPALITAFETAIGGANNGANATTATTGFRVIDWDAVKLDNTDFGGGANTTVISQGNTVGIPQNRFQARGVFFGGVEAVSGNGFTTVNPGVNNLFTAFSPSNTFASFNDNKIDVFFATPTGVGSTPAPAGTKGFGAVFLNSQIAGASTIEYFQGDKSLGKFSVPTGTQGQAEFLGVLYDKPIVTHVQLTLGNATLFNFNGSTFTTGGTNDATNNLVATDDFVYAEPQPAADLPALLNGPAGTNAATAKVTTTVGTPFTGSVATFTSDVATDTAARFFAVINWGDGHITNGVVTANSQGGFDVSGTNTYATAGNFPVTVTVRNFQGDQVTVANTAVVNRQATTVTLATSGTPSRIGQAVTYTATVANAGASPGTVTFFDGTTALGTVPVVSGTATFTTSSLTPGTHAITATYNGDANTLASTSTAVSQVVSPDVTSGLRVQVIRIRRAGRRIRERLSITNTGNDTITGPVLLIFDNLSANATLQNASGTTQTIAPLNSPFLRLNLGSNNRLAPGSSVTVDVTFLSRRRVTFTPRVLSGVTTA